MSRLHVWLICLLMLISSCYMWSPSLHTAAVQGVRHPVMRIDPSPVSSADRSKLGVESSARRVLGVTSVVASLIAFPQLSDAYGVVEEPVKKKKNKLKVGETDKGIKYIDLKEGSGPFPQSGDLIAINYIGFKKDGTQFDSQYSKKNLSFKFGANQIIPGIEDVLETMRPGAQRSCTIPAKYAYGDKGICVKDGCIVEPGEDLKFVITLNRVAAGYQ